MKAVSRYCDRALKMGIDGAKVINTGSVVTAEWVRIKCQYGCFGYGETLCCPPYSPTPEVTRRMLDSYHKAILPHKRIHSEKTWELFNRNIVHLEIEMFLYGYYKAFSMGCGPCDLCIKCKVAEKCKHRDRARPSMEACGIDVFKTARDNGFKIQVIRNNEVRNEFGLVLVK